MASKKDFNGAQLMEVELAKITIPDYQRQVSERWAQDIANNWSQHLFRHPYLVPRPDGLFDCVDGQHECLAASYRGHTTIPAYVLNGVAHREAAAIFSDINTRRKRPEPYNVWNADFIAGRQWAVDFNEIAKANGLEIAHNKAPTAICCVAQARTILESHGYNLLAETLAVLVGAWPDADNPENASRVEGTLVVAMADLIRRAKALGRYDRQRFISRLARFRFTRFGVSARLTPAAFGQAYMASLIESGDLPMPPLSSGSSSSAARSRAFAIAIFGKSGWRDIYGEQ